MQFIPGLILALAIFAADVVIAADTALPAERERPPTTASGISAGGIMAHQLHVAYPELFDGVGIIAGAPFGCAEGQLGVAMSRCMGAAKAPPVAELVERARAAVAEERLGPAKALAGDRVWLFHGARDTIVSAAVSGAVADFYRAWQPQVEVAREQVREAGHVFPTVDAGGECTALTAPFIGACGYDAAGELLRFLHGDLAAPSGTPDAAAALEAVELPGAADAGLLPEAWLYRPDGCAEGGCPVHLVLHGCGQSTAQIGRQFMEQSGYLPWAEANDLVLAFPQVAPSPVNPLACWDWWGYTGADYLWRTAPQLALLAGWVQRLGG